MIKKIKEFFSKNDNLVVIRNVVFTAAIISLFISIVLWHVIFIILIINLCSVELKDPTILYYLAMISCSFAFGLSTIGFSIVASINRHTDLLNKNNVLTKNILESFYKVNSSVQFLVINDIVNGTFSSDDKKTLKDLYIKSGYKVKDTGRQFTDKQDIDSFAKKLSEQIDKSLSNFGLVNGAHSSENYLPLVQEKLEETFGDLESICYQISIKIDEKDERFIPKEKIRDFYVSSLFFTSIFDIAANYPFLKSVVDKSLGAKEAEINFD